MFGFSILGIGKISALTPEIVKSCSKHTKSNSNTKTVQVRGEYRDILRYRDSVLQCGERGGSVVECRTPEREVRGSKPTAAVLCP